MLRTWSLITICPFLLLSAYADDRPYVTKEVRFNGGSSDVVLAGELTYPTDGGSYPAVILITGSGPQDRDETLGAHKPFKVLANFLSRRGYAVLRFDDRGIHESTGDYATATEEDFAADAAAAIRWLGTQPAIDNQRMGFIGHSEGGYIAPLAALEEKVEFMVLLASPVVPLVDVILLQEKEIAAAEGKSKSYIEESTLVTRKLIDIFRSSSSPEQARDQVISLFESHGSNLGLADRHAEYLLDVLPPAWWMWIVDYDPVPALESFDGPILAIYGAKDLQVSAIQNAPVMVKVLSHELSDVVVLDDLNHLFQLAKTGAPSEYASIKAVFDGRMLNVVGGWLDTVTKYGTDDTNTTNNQGSTK